MKGASVIRSLAALIGDDPLRQGLSDYLSRFAFSSATLDDLVGCWSRASGQDLAGWAEQWLRAEGTTTIRLESTGAVVQDVPRRQHIGIGLYDLNGDGQLQRRCLMPSRRGRPGPLRVSRWNRLTCGHGYLVDH